MKTPLQVHLNLAEALRRVDSSENHLYDDPDGTLGSRGLNQLNNRVRTLKKHIAREAIYFAKPRQPTQRDVRRLHSILDRLQNETDRATHYRAAAQLELAYDAARDAEADIEALL